jgi:ubiquinone/menaquinone biosynthesis C-methylase UbiE
MSYLTDPPREQPSTYFVEDLSNQEEMARLEVQDKMLNTGMGSLLPKFTDPASLGQILDVGCGTGGWLLETARTYPTIEKLFGVDISSKMLAHARAQAEARQLDGRVQFRVMDALQRLDFPGWSFDLVNQRLGFSWLRTWDWKKIFAEYKRVTRPGGIIQITESNAAVESDSPAQAKFARMLLEAFYNSGRLFAPTIDGVTGELVHLMTEHGIENVQSQVHTLVYRVGTVEWQYLYEDMVHFSRVMVPFFQKWANVPHDYQEICQQAFKEMQQPDFVATMTLLTVWGTTRKDGRGIPMAGW